MNIDQKAAILTWLISAQGLNGIPSISSGYDLTVDQLVDLYGARLDDDGYPVPVNVNSIYYPDGRRLAVSELPQETIVNISGSDILSGPVTLLPAPPDGCRHEIIGFEFNVCLDSKLKFMTL